MKLDSFKRPLPAYAMILVLLIGVAGGAYISLALTQGVLSSKPNTPDFGIGAVPSSSSAYPGSLATFTLRLTSLNGFAGSVNLTAIPPIAGIDPLVDPNSVSLLVGNATSTLTVSVANTTPAGTYTVSSTGTSGKLSHIVQVFVTVTSAPPPDFAFSVDTSSITLTRGTSATSGLTLSGLSGFSGNIMISAAISPAVGSGPTISINPASVTVPPGGTANSLLTISTSGTTPRQGYVIYVLATSGSLSHSIQISLTVQ